MSFNLGDAFLNAAKKYIIPTPQEEEKEETGKKERKLLAPMKYSESTRKQITEPLTPEKQFEVALQCPLFMKGVRKKGMDSTRAWCNYKLIFGEGSIIKKDLKLIREFEAKVQIKKKFFEMFQAAYVYGNGYALITFTNDDDVPLYLPPRENAVPYKLDLLNSEFINDIDYFPGITGQEGLTNYFHEKQILHYHYIDTKNLKDVWIHPTRILDLPCDPMVNNRFGNSKTNQLRNVLLSKINIDIAVGEILAWFAHGFLDITVENPQNDDEMKEYDKIAKSHPGFWIHGNELTLGVENPEAINPKPYYDYIVMLIAACLVMPTHILTGIQTGRVTGSEIGFSDYYRDIHDIQEMDYTPLINKLYSMLFKASGREWIYTPIWNTIYVDELGEAEIMFKRAETIDKLRNGSAGPVIDTKEARQVLQDGMADFSGELEPESPNKPQPPKRPIPGDDEEDAETDGDKTGPGNKTD